MGEIIMNEENNVFHILDTSFIGGFFTNLFKNIIMETDKIVNTLKIKDGD